MRTQIELIEEIAALRALEPGHREAIAGCARNRVFGAGESLLHEGDPADTFYVVREGTVVVQREVPGRGAVTLETLGAGELLGWSWLLPPYRAAFDARAATTTHALAFDAACLRGKLDRDPALGYALLTVLAAVFTDRLHDARMRLLDLYGPPT